MPGLGLTGGRPAQEEHINQAYGPAGALQQGAKQMHKNTCLHLSVQASLQICR